MMQARLLSRAVVLVVTGLVAGVGWAGEIDVVSRGAKGDGVADDTAAFVAAFKAGLDVYVPAGTYLIDDLTLPENGYLHGAGRASTILLKSGEGAIRPGSGCRISNLHFTGQDAFDAKPAGNQGKALINIPQGHNITIDHVRIDNYRFTGLHTDHVTDLRITNSHFENLNWAIILVFSNRVLVQGNRVINTMQHGIQFWGNWKFERMEMSDLAFIGNYVKDGGNGAIWGTGARRVIMANNIIDGATDVGLDLEWCADSTITGNTVRNCVVAGIALFFASERVSITGNTVINDRPIDDPDAKWFVRAGIWLTPPNREKFKNDYGHRDVAIVGNTIHSPQDGSRRGMWIGSEVKNVTIESNALSGPGIYYGGHHAVHPLRLEQISQPVVLDARPTPDEPKF
ncbi:MAG: right-handed parallel beta-helix repeat-containing protein [Phycisphaeraceae bacterium]|jgi:parallel beta-helix repeat protein|nr:right-handed parallel beta-helix repeat-containing protein [Phycisphaeraceae bacterium]MDP7346945.1 right-handed parallel beta-helix repeat-containing protein [Phycisphaeraceae bacterium]